MLDKLPGPTALRTCGDIDELPEYRAGDLPHLARATALRARRRARPLLRSGAVAILAGHLAFDAQGLLDSGVNLFESQL